MRPRIARKHLESFREALGDINGHPVIVRVPVRELRIHAVEWHRHRYARTILEPSRIALLRCTRPQESGGETAQPPEDAPRFGAGVKVHPLAVVTAVPGTAANIGAGPHILPRPARRQSAKLFASNWGSVELISTGLL